MSVEKAESFAEKISAEGRRLSNSKKVEKAIADNEQKIALRFTGAIKNNNQNRAAEIVSLCKILETKPQITHLDLKLNNLGDEGLNKILIAIKDNPSITHLDVSLNSITSVGMGYLTDFVKQNKTVKRIEIGANKMEEDAARNYVKAVNENPVMEKDVSLVATPVAASKHSNDELYRTETWADVSFGKPRVEKPAETFAADATNEAAKKAESGRTLGSQ